MPGAFYWPLWQPCTVSKKLKKNRKIKPGQFLTQYFCNTYHRVKKGRQFSKFSERSITLFSNLRIFLAYWSFLVWKMLWCHCS
jgi:hypothetical protein